MLNGRIHSIETLGALDGPGIRTVVFMQGCNMRCVYCHNPDSWTVDGGYNITVMDLVNKLKRYIPYYNKNGGVTFSGGEPLLQAEFLLEVVKELKQLNIHVALDTSGSVANNEVFRLISMVDLIILDIKHSNYEKFEQITANKMDNLLKIIDYCMRIQNPIWIRQVIVKGINDNREDLNGLKNIIAGLNVQKLELLPYHNDGAYKWEKLGLEYKLSEENIPNMEFLKTVEDE